MRAGSLRHQIDLQSVTNAANGYGEQTETWATYDTVWASIEPVSAKEIISADQQVGVATHKIRIRYRVVDVKHRVLFGSRVFEITSVINFHERSIFLDLLCNEAV